MIQIKRYNLEELANEHCEKLKEQLNIESKLDDQIASGKHQPFWKFLKSNLDSILKGNKQALLGIIQEIKDKKLLPDLKNGEGKDSEEKKNIEKIFNYEAFSPKKENADSYDGYSLAKNLNVDTCPYCNRQYTFTLMEVENNKKKSIVRPDLDHFIPKDKYPYLALSFYNLIPCCQICNSRFKLNKAFTFEGNLHPYSEGWEDKSKFQLKIYKSDFFNGKFEIKDEKEIKIKTSIIEINTKNAGNLKNKIDNNNEVFKLKELYQEHLDYVFELVNKAMIYNDDYIDSLFKQFEGSLFRNREDVLRFVTANYIDDDDLHLRPLSKLTKDIIEQFDL